LEWRDFDEDRREVIKRAVDRGVKNIVDVGYSLESSLKALELAHSNPGIYAAVGIHPHEASAVTPDALESLARLSSDPKVVAIGEIGLDYYRNLSPRGRSGFSLQSPAGVGKYPRSTRDNPLQGGLRRPNKNASRI
jgi:TatD DNase family protein